MPSRGTQSLRKYGCQRTSTGTSGASASAFSRRRLPMKHHGQTTSETTSIGMKGEELMTGLQLLAEGRGRTGASQPRSSGRPLVAKRVDHQRIAALLGELVANDAPVRAHAGEAMAGERVGERGDRAVRIDRRDQV